MASRKLTSEEAAALQELRSRLLLTLEYMESVEDFPMGQRFRTIVESSAEECDLRALRLMKRDIDGMKLALLPQQREELETLLRERLGVDQALERLEEREAITRILKRGTVRSEKERRRVQEYVECLEATGGDPVLIGQLNGVLAKG